MCEPQRKSYILLQGLKSMPTYKLTYFDARGRAEVARLMFAQAGMKYEDVRVKAEDFPKVKPTLVTGSMPELEVDGKILTGSGPINRYLAEQLGFTSNDGFERAKIGGWTWWTTSSQESSV